MIKSVDETQEWFIENFASREGESGELAPAKRAEALARLDSLNEVERDSLKWVAKTGWETERLLLLEKCDFKTRLAIEKVTAWHNGQSDKLHGLLFRLRDAGFFSAPEADPVTNVPGSIEMIVSDLEADKAHIEALRADLDKENKTWSRDQLAARFEVSPNQITNYRREAREAGILTSKRSLLTSEEFELFRRFVDAKPKRKHSKTQ